MGIVVTLNALYHTTVIRLNRHVRVHALSGERIGRNITESFRNALDFLFMIQSLTAASRQGRVVSNLATTSALATPFTGYALTLAVDVVTSAGTVPQLRNLIQSVVTISSCIEELGELWAPARAQHKAVSSRLRHLDEMANQGEQGVRSGSFGHYWRVPESLDSAFGNNDAVYRCSDHLLFEVVGSLGR